MRRCIRVALIVVISSGAFADERKDQSNVYDDLQPSATATVDEKVTALIKRYMASLLYPVDMSSFL
jgi:hypothetical protein